MTKKHFVELAKLMCRTRKFLTHNAYIVICHDMADLCARNSANFNRTKFMEACKL
jgi:hypothetical protein